MINSVNAQSARKKVERLRRNNGNIINATFTTPADQLDSIFVTQRRENIYSLSVHNNTNNFINRSFTQSNINLFATKDQQLQPVPEEPIKDDRLPNFANPQGLEAVQTSAINEHRQQQA